MDFEIKIIEFLQSGRTQFFDVSFQVISQIGSIIGCAAVCLLFLIFDRKHLFWFLFTYGWTNIIVRIIKACVQRVRPFDASSAIVSIGDVVTDYSFPSGHTALAVSIAIFLGYFLWQRCRKKSSRVWICVLLSLYVILVGVSRMYLGKHYLTDVLAGGAIAAVVCVLGLMFMRYCQKRREKEKNESKTSKIES